MFTHLSGWKSRVEIDQSAREGRLRQEWREAPHENARVSIPVIFWSVLGSVAQSVQRLPKPPGSLGCSATQSRLITIRFRRGPNGGKAFSLRSARSRLKTSLAPEGAGTEPSLEQYRPWKHYEPPRAGRLQGRSRRRWGAAIAARYWLSVQKNRLLGQAPSLTASVVGARRRSK